MSAFECAHGIHEWEPNASGTRQYCRICGEPRVAPPPDYDFRTHSDVSAVYDEMPQLFSRDLGPVRLPTRAELLADSRRAAWREIASAPKDRPIIVWSPNRPHVYLRITDPADWSGFSPNAFWHEDTLGVPLT